MKRIVPVILFNIGFAKTNAQHIPWPAFNDSGTVLQGKFHNPHPFIAFIEPSAAVSLFYNSSLRAGLEFPVFRPLNMYISCCYFLAGGYGAKAGLKLYADKNTWRNIKKGFFRAVDKRPFIALEYYYKSQSYSVVDSVTAPPYGERTYHVDKSAHSFSFQVGELITHNSGWTFEWFGGIGFRLKTVTNDLKAGETDTFYHWHEGQADAPSNSKATNALVLHFALGFRLGLRLR